MSYELMKYYQTFGHSGQDGQDIELSSLCDRHLNELRSAAEWHLDCFGGSHDHLNQIVDEIERRKNK